MSEQNEYGALVIGAGISGLTLAHALRGQERSVCVLERDARVGGALHSHRPVDGFWLELGGHTGYNSYGRLLGIVEDLGLAERLLKRATAKWMLWKGQRPVSVPSQLNWPELAISLPRLLMGRGDEESVADFYSRVLGRRNFERVLRPMFSAVVSQDAAEIPAALLFKKRPRRKDRPRSFAFGGGLQGIAEAIAGQTGITVRNGANGEGTGEVRSVARTGAAWRVTTADGATHSAPVLGLATAPDVAARLLAEAVPQASSALAGIGVAAIETEGVIVRDGHATLAPMAGLVGVEAPFRSVVTQDPVPHPEFRGFSFHFRPETPAEERSAQMTAVLGCTAEDLEFRVSARRTLPSPRPGHAARLERLQAALAEASRQAPLLLTGNYFGGLAIEDCVTRSQEEAARLER